MTSVASLERLPDGRVRIRTPYDTWVCALIKRTFAVRRFDGTSRGWDVEVTPQALERFAVALQDAGWTLVDANVRIPPRRVALPPTLYRHQEQGVRWLMQRGQALLADEPGLGKTRQAIEAAHRVAERTLVLAPASLLCNWQDEIARWTGQQATILDSKNTLPGPRWNIASYDTAKGKGRGTLGAALRKHAWDLVICDEAHLCRRSTSARWKLVYSLKAPRRWLLTATPVYNDLDDLFHLLALTDHYLTQGPNALKFWSGWQGRQEELFSKHLAQWALRRVKAHCLDLPPLTRRTLRVAVSRQWQHVKPRDLGHLEQLRCELAIHKTQATLEQVALLLDAQHKVVVFSGYPAALDVIENTLKTGVVRIDGSTPRHQRHEAVQRFQNDADVRVFLGQIIAAGTGLTLTAASNVLFNDMDYSPAAHTQAEQRCHRIGTHAPVEATYIVGDCPLDARLNALMRRKLSQARATEGAIDPNALLAP